MLAGRSAGSVAAAFINSRDAEMRFRRGASVSELVTPFCIRLRRGRGADSLVFAPSVDFGDRGGRPRGAWSHAFPGGRAPRAPSARGGRAGVDRRR